ncbi:Sec-independent protein translocase subunit TatA/TatB [Halobaculum sp. EA56]|uniref:Sec-independent protein translocase subunit TatA/TatB n=1 Tax=Halobaculum sp. EA56 TaxID=3421648 RepID=UPI003EB715B2
MLTTLPLFGAIPGGPEMLIILLVLVLLFGANKIPKLARSTGQAMGEFKKGREQVEEELQEMQEGDTGEDDEFAADTTSTTDTSTTESVETETATDESKN